MLYRYATPLTAEFDSNRFSKHLQMVLAFVFGPVLVSLSCVNVNNHITRLLVQKFQSRVLSVILELLTYPVLLL